MNIPFSIFLLLKGSGNMEFSESIVYSEKKRLALTPVVRVKE